MHDLSVSACRVETARNLVAAGVDDELQPLVIDHKRSLDIIMDRSNAEKLVLDATVCHTPFQIRQNGFEFDIRPFEIVWWAEGTRASVYLSIITNYAIWTMASSNECSLMIQFKQRMVDPRFYIKPSAKADILACPESQATLQYFEGKQAEIFIISIPFEKKMLPTMEKRVITSTKGMYPSVMVFILIVAPELTYDDAESCEGL
jgi:hypothetical protein